MTLEEDSILRIKSDMKNSVIAGIKSTGGFLEIDFKPGCLTVGCSWRFSGPDWMTGSDSVDADAFGRLSEAVLGRKILDIRIIGSFNDLCFNLADDLSFESFSDDQDFESWSLHSPEGNIYVAGPKRLFSKFLKT